MAHPFRDAVENKDLDAMTAALAPDVTFRSPAVFKPYEGREATLALLSMVVRVFEDFEYVDELRGTANGKETLGLVFKARVGDKQVDGWDYLTLDDDGKITDFTVMIRPLSGLLALAEAMKQKLEAAQPA